LSVVCRIFVGKPLGGANHLKDWERRWENNIQVHLREIDLEDERWVLEPGINGFETLGSKDVVFVIFTRSRLFVLYLHI